MVLYAKQSATCGSLQKDHEDMVLSAICSPLHGSKNKITSGLKDYSKVLNKRSLRLKFLLNA
jgi:hypothetical protein